jgi:plasmid stability protein
MGDMLIRGIDQNLKRQLEESARRNHRSLSEEAIALIVRGITLERSEGLKAGDQLRLLVGEAFFTTEELNAIAASRSEPDRDPPDLA